MTLQLLHSEFSSIWEKFDFLFYQYMMEFIIICIHNKLYKILSKVLVLHNFFHITLKPPLHMLSVHMSRYKNFTPSVVRISFILFFFIFCFSLVIMVADSRRPHFYERKLGKHISFLPSWFKEESWLLRTKTPASNNHKIAAEPSPTRNRGDFLCRVQTNTPYRLENLTKLTTHFSFISYLYIRIFFIF